MGSTGDGMLWERVRDPAGKGRRMRFDGARLIHGFGAHAQAASEVCSTANVLGGRSSYQAR